MMERAEAQGLGIAAIGHIALLAALTLSLRPTQNVPEPPPSVEVTFVEEAALTSASPTPLAAPPPPSAAPEAGPPEEATPAPEPAPAPPEPTPAPPPPTPQPQPQPRPQPAPPRPQPRVQPTPQPQPRAQPAPAPRPQPPQAQPAPRPQPPQALPRRPTPGATARPAPPAQPPQQRAGTGTAERTRGARLDSSILRGIGNDPAPSPRPSPPAATMSPRAAADIGSAIARQVQPCADRQVHPGSGAERIVTPIILRLNRDGSLVGRPRVGTQSGLDDENRRYADRVADLAIRSFVECAPLRSLPEELYDVPNGWRNFTLRYRLPA